MCLGVGNMAVLDSLVFVVLCTLVSGKGSYGHQLPPYTPYEQQEYEGPEVDYNTCDDIAIIGAGISGSYTAWRLRERGWKISLFEYSDRIGGRLHTVKLPGIPDINAELGAMRFKPNDHTLFNQTVHELGLKVVDFAPGFGASGETLYYLRGKHMKYNDLPTQAPYNIPDRYRYDYNTLSWHVFVNYTIDSNVEDPLSSYNKQRIRSLDGVKLGAQSRKTYDSKYLDSETAAYIADASSFISQFGPMSAASSLPVKDPNKPSGPDPVKTVAKGFQAVPEKLVKQFIAASNRHRYQPNHHLRSIYQGDYGVSILSFQPTATNRGYTYDITNAPRITTCARKVVLAVTQMALQHLDWPVLKTPLIKHLLDNSVMPTIATKIYFGYNSTWWRNLPLATPYAISTTPLRQTYDFGKSNITGGGLLNPSYTDVYADFWRSVQNAGTPVRGSVDGDMTLSMSKTSVNLARKYYAEVFNVTVNHVPFPHSAVMKIWDYYPIGASWYEWMPDFIWEGVEARMLKPSATDEVYILGNIFSGDNLSGWSEGALVIAEKFIAMLDRPKAPRRRPG